MSVVRSLSGALLAQATCLAACLALAVPAGAHAQQPAGVDPETLPVEVTGASDVALDRRLSRLLDADPIILTRATFVGAADTLRGSVLVLDATLVLEGVVTGDLVLVDAGAFVRPGAVVGGDLVNIGGGLYRSEISRVQGTIIDLPTASYVVVREPDRIRIVASDTPSALSLDGFMGIQPPSYDRVNGLTLKWGARYTLPQLGDVAPSVHGEIGWLTERGEPTYGASARLRRFATTIEAGYEKGWATNEDWLQGDLRNALNYAWDGDDFRDYHDSERSWVGVQRALGDEAKSFHSVVGVRGQVENATSLTGDEPWHLWSGDVRPNPAIDPGRTTSVVAHFDMTWKGRETAFEGRVEYEAAREWLDGDFTFDRVAVQGDWAMHALANHTLEIEFFVQQPLGGGVMPLQEWSFVGGSGTLQTLAFAEYTGDRVIFTETKYIIPLPERLALPLVGAPELQLLHGSGMAWIEGEDPAFQQEVGARLQFFVLYFRYVLDPADPSNNDLDIGLSWPFGGGHPWETP